MRTSFHSIISCFFCIFLFWGLNNHALANETQYLVKKEKPFLENGKSLQLKQPLFNIGAVGTDYVEEHTAIIALVYGREDRTDLQGKIWFYEINYDLIDQVTTSTIGSGTVRVEHSNTDGIYESIEAHKNVSGDVKIVITGINATSPITSVPDDIRLELRLNVERYYYLNPQMQTNLAVDVDNTKHQATAKWEFISGAEYYEMEWVFWDALNDGTAPINDPDLLFEDAIRVQTPNAHYELDLVYPEGDFYFRVRPVGRFILNVIDNSIEKRGAWSDYYWLSDVDVIAFETGQNWQFNRAYAEDGKFSQGVSYYDDVMRARQALTNMNSENNSLIAETVYDVENRPSISVMPVPVKNPTGSYLAFGGGHEDQLFTGQHILPAVNSGIEYIRTNYDIHNHDNTTNPALIPTLDTNHIASQYYSAPTGDPFADDIHRDYVPDAQGYPMAQVQYMNDGTGRVRRASGLGSFYQIHSGHESEFFYVSATTTELQRMFGQNVGEAGHYRKNYAVDANGQISVTYFDKAGMVIATALAGSTPENVQALDGTVETRLETLMGGNKKFEESRTSELTHPFFCDQPQIYSFSYDLVKGINVYDGGTFCIGCTYELEIVVKDEFGAVQPCSLNTSNANVTITNGVLNATYSSTEAPCSGEDYPVNSIIGFEVNIPALGRYTISKILRVTGPEVDSMLNYLVHNELVTSQQTFINNYVNFNFDSTECEPCNAAFAQNIAADLVLLENPGLDVTDPPSYQSLVDNHVNNYSCAELMELYNLLQNLGSLGCNALLGRMKTQMSPGGCLYDAGGFYTEIFVTDGEVMPTILEYSPSGVPTALPTTSATTFASILEDDTRWQDHWIDDLIQYHPEFCRYQACGSNAQFNSDTFDYQMAKIQNWEEAYAKYQTSGVNLTGGIDDTEKRLIALDILQNEDPSISPPYASSDLYNALFDYCTTQCSIAALISQPCTCLGSDVFNFLELGGPMGIYAPTTSKEHWDRFRGIYMSEKLKIYYQDLVTSCPLDSPGNFSISPYPCDELFGEPQVTLSNGTQTGFLTGLDNIGDLEDAIIANVTGNGTASSTMCVDLCAGRAEQWIESLCPGLKADAAANPTTIGVEYNAMKAALENYCLEGCGSLDHNPLGFLLKEDVDFPTNTNLAVAATRLSNLQASPYLRCVGATLSDIDVERLDVYEPFTSYNNLMAGLPIAEPKCSVVTNILTQLNTLFPTEVISTTGTVYTSIDFTHPNMPTGAAAAMLGIPSATTYTAINSNLTALTGDPYYDNWAISQVTLNNEHNYLSIDGTLDYVNRFIQVDGTNFCQTCSPSNNCNTLGIEFVRQTGEQINPMEIISIGTYDCNTNLVSVTFPDVHCAYSSNQTNPLPGTACTTYGTITEDVFVRINNKDAIGSPCEPEWEWHTQQWVPISESVTIDPLLAIQQCNAAQIAILTQDAEDAYQNYLNSILTQMLLEDKCLDVTEEFTMEFLSTEQYYTLYYYDAMGDLVQTIPPEGVDLLNAGPSSADFTNGILNQGVHNAHDTAQFTKYKYNSLGQVVLHHSPDRGMTKFFYDYAQRLRLSQNVEQAPNGNTESSYGTGGSYAYTKFDEQGRMIESGKLDSYVVDQKDLNIMSFPDAPFTSDETFTKYDNAVTSGTLVQNNQRGRVSQTYNKNMSSYYDYDVHGNVTKVQYQIKNFGVSEMEYKYDLITGNVNEVAFQKGTRDQFFHRYTYDADNRLLKVLTSKNAYSWDNDARYFYYAHGPLARVEVGNDKVQGMDYYYNLQGWTKGVNNTTADTDMGLDAYKPSSGLNKNQWFGKDEFAFHLGYHREDYIPIGGVSKLGVLTETATSIFDNDILGTSSVEGLYNGNIAFMVTHIPKLTTLGRNSTATNAMVYQYDALHRIKEARSYHLDGKSEWTRDTEGNRYDTEYWYDLNGNLTDLHRWARTQNDMIDDLHYDYNVADNKINQLLRVSDARGQVLTDDLASQSSPNYKYDKLGNMISDNSQSITKVQWNLMQKIDRVERATVDGGNIDFTYDPSGSRLTKTTYTTSGVAETTVYIRDITGNIMATYEMADELRSNPGETPGTFTDPYSKSLKEVVLYGASRLGVKKMDTYWQHYEKITDAPAQMSETVIILAPTQWGDASTRGDKLYESSNHLGNVLITFSDKKIGKVNNLLFTSAEYYDAIVTTANDYYPFGWTMPNRRVNPGNYSFGFNGQETDTEWNGGQSVNFLFRVHDPRIGRFLSVDPLAPSYPHYTPYQFAGNMPIWAVDLEGAEELKTNGGVKWNGGGTEASGNQTDLPTQTVSPKSDIGSEALSTLSSGSLIGDMVIGVIPVIGTGVDITNAVIEFRNGNYLAAAGNSISAIPIAGDAAAGLWKGGKYLYNGWKRGIGNVFGGSIATKVIRNPTIGPKYIDDPLAILQANDKLGINHTKDAWGFFRKNKAGSQNNCGHCSVNSHHYDQTGEILQAPLLDRPLLTKEVEALFEPKTVKSFLFGKKTITPKFSATGQPFGSKKWYISMSDVEKKLSKMKDGSSIIVWAGRGQLTRKTGRMIYDQGHYVHVKVMGRTPLIEEVQTGLFKIDFNFYEEYSKSVGKSWNTYQIMDVTGFKLKK